MGSMPLQMSLFSVSSHSCTKCCNQKMHKWLWRWRCSFIPFFLFCSVIPVLQFLSGVVKRDITTSLLLECTVEAVPPVTLVEIRRRDEDGDVVLSTMSGSSQIQTLHYTLGNLMVNDSGAYVCMARNPIGLREQNFTLVVQGEWLPNILLTLKIMTTINLA